ncbi:hypothetical protein L249_0073 [Ophiocordyceps polyrhachis-furcata BCC 54312]|uniref:Uncharacterized protein n=1 Tax=Ophiocordyceps polyrhachis-furcata BCC 54312 TaxID=1330021 RepID=A0A367LF63_9HYPO|nr:hypothetical protein L249_0073 [Ophiocordyceps polyrhachis-furcata BCC 54312]
MPCNKHVAPLTRHLFLRLSSVRHRHRFRIWGGEGGYGDDLRMNRRIRALFWPFLGGGGVCMPSSHSYAERALPTTDSQRRLSGQFPHVAAWLFEHGWEKRGGRWLPRLFFPLSVSGKLGQLHGSPIVVFSLSHLLIILPFLRSSYVPPSFASCTASLTTLGERTYACPNLRDTTRSRKYVAAGRFCDAATGLDKEELLTYSNFSLFATLFVLLKLTSYCNQSSSPMALPSSLLSSTVYGVQAAGWQMACHLSLDVPFPVSFWLPNHGMANDSCRHGGEYEYVSVPRPTFCVVGQIKQFWGTSPPFDA